MKYVNRRDLFAGSGYVDTAPAHTEAGFHLGYFGSADRDAVRRLTVQLKQGSVALLPDEGHILDSRNIATMNSDKKSGIELGFRF